MQHMLFDIFYILEILVLSFSNQMVETPTSNTFFQAKHYISNKIILIVNKVYITTAHISNAFLIHPIYLQ